MTNGYLRRASCGGAISGALAASACALLLLSVPALAESKFDKVAVYFERNAADDDIEVRFLATANEKGLVELRVTAPDGRIVVDFKAPDSKTGIRTFDLETPEPPLNDGRLQKDFPSGVYRFEGTEVGGEKLKGEATLDPVVPDAPTITSPQKDRVDIATKGARIRWQPVKDAVSYVIALEDEEKERTLKVTLPGDATSLNIPDNFLAGGTKYTLEVGAVLKNGNRSFQEFEFTSKK
jgi:hypothetical protein